MKDLNLFRVKDSVYLKIVSSKDEALGDLDCDGILIRGDEKVARSIIASLRDRNKEKGIKDKEYLIGIFGGDDAFNRRVVESLKVDYLVSVEASTGRDNLKQRDSGLNHAIAKIAKEKGILIVVDMGAIAGLRGKEKGVRISRVMQNVRVCRKVGCGIRIASLGLDKKSVVDVKGRQSFGITLGMSSSEVRDCVLF